MTIRSAHCNFILTICHVCRAPCLDCATSLPRNATLRLFRRNRFFFFFVDNDQIFYVENFQFCFAEENCKSKGRLLFFFFPRRKTQFIKALCRWFNYMWQIWQPFHQRHGCRDDAEALSFHSSEEGVNVNALFNLP